VLIARENRHAEMLAFVLAKRISPQDAHVPDIFTVRYGLGDGPLHMARNKSRGIVHFCNWGIRVDHEFVPLSRTLAAAAPLRTVSFTEF
jgi:hypothetical protein